jgi:hypothetical protein
MLKPDRFKLSFFDDVYFIVIARRKLWSRVPFGPEQFLMKQSLVKRTDCFPRFLGTSFDSLRSSKLPRNDGK